MRIKGRKKRGRKSKSRWRGTRRVDGEQADHRFPRV